MARSKTKYKVGLILASALLICMVGAVACSSKEGSGMKLSKVALSSEASLYPEAGFLKGVSGAYGGAVGEWVVYGGGCNFPEKGPLEGGAKVYYSSIYAFKCNNKGEVETIRIGDLIEPVGYGASLLSRDGKRLYLVGGTNGREATQHIHVVEANDEGVPAIRLSEHTLPITWFEGAGVSDGENLYLLGGWQANGLPNDSVWQVNVETGEAEAIAQLPDGARIQPVAFAHEGALYLFGGHRPSSGAGDLPYMHRKGYRLSLSNPAEGWEEIAENPTLSDDGRKLLFVGSTATYDVGEQKVYVVGGVDWDIFANAVEREYHQAIAKAEGDEEALKRFAEARVAYMTMAPEEYLFMPHIITYQPEQEAWVSVASDTAFATAGAVLVAQDDALYVIGGERKPGVRTFDAWRWEK